jgi:hypothetical protein
MHTEQVRFVVNAKGMTWKPPSAPLAPLRCVFLATSLQLRRVTATWTPSRSQRNRRPPRPIGALTSEMHDSRREGVARATGLVAACPASQPSSSPPRSRLQPSSASPRSREQRNTARSSCPSGRTAVELDGELAVTAVHPLRRRAPTLAVLLPTRCLSDVRETKRVDLQSLRGRDGCERKILPPGRLAEGHTVTFACRNFHWSRLDLRPAFRPARPRARCG